eukprot:scaffold143_cov175-Prasinococcus_capsulatus_cf.AAC.1
MLLILAVVLLARLLLGVVLVIEAGELSQQRTHGGASEPKLQGPRCPEVATPPNRNPGANLALSFLANFRLELRLAHALVGE